MADRKLLASVIMVKMDLISIKYITLYYIYTKYL